MPNITKLKLQDDIEYTLSAPILLDQEESTSTTSAPSSNYLKTRLDNIESDIENIYYIINTRLLQVLRLKDGTDLNTVAEVGQYTINKPANFIPDYAGWVCLYVTRYDNNPEYAMQIAIIEAGVYTRACMGGEWRYWCKLDRTPITE